MIRLLVSAVGIGLELQDMIIPSKPDAVDIGPEGHDALGVLLAWSCPRSPQGSIGRGVGARQLHVVDVLMPQAC